MNETDTDAKASQPIANEDQLNRKPPPDGVHLYVMAVDNTAIKQAKFYVDLELAKEDSSLEIRFLIRKGTIVPGWLLEGLDKPPIEYFKGPADASAALERLMGEELIKEIMEGKAVQEIFK